MTGCRLSRRQSVLSCGIFPANLRHITGELLLALGEFENYASMIELPGAEGCIVTRYHSAQDSTVSWQAKMLSSDEYGKAEAQYRTLYQQLQNCPVNLIDDSVAYLSGVWEPSKEESSFTTSSFRLHTSDPRYDEVKVELELVYQLADWAVHINIFTKKRDDEVGGSGVAGNQ